MPSQTQGKSGQVMEVNGLGQAYAYNRDQDAILNDLGRVFLAYSGATPTAGASRVFAHVANTNTRASLSVVEFVFSCGAAETVDIFLGSKEAAGLTGGTVTDLRGLNGGMKKIPSVIFNSANAITGFDPNAVIVDFLHITAANAVDRRAPKAQIVVPPNGVIFARTNTSGAAVKFGIIFTLLPLLEETS